MSESDQLVSAEGITLVDSICLADGSSVSPLVSPHKDALAASNAIKSSTDELDTVTFGTIDDILSPMEDNQEMPQAEAVDDKLQDATRKSASETLDQTSDSQMTVFDDHSKAETKSNGNSRDTAEESVRRDIEGLVIGCSEVEQRTTNNEGFQETKVGSPGSQFLYEKDAPLQVEDEAEMLTKEPIRSISSYFAGVDPEESHEEPRDMDFDFLGHASISPEDGAESAGRLKSVSCVLSQTSNMPTEPKDRLNSMSNFFEMESADDTMDAMVAPPEQFAADENSKQIFDNLVIPEDVRSRSSSQSSAQFDSLATPPIASDSSFLALDSNNHEAWIPSERTRSCLVNLNTAPPGSFYPDMDQVTMPGVLLEESLGDPVKELVNRFHGPQEASNRQIMNANSVPQDESGLRFLISSECFRSAVDLTGRLLTNLGQGPGKLGQPSRHTPTTLQLWLTRASLLMKLHMFTAAEAELEAFGNFDRADLYYSYYPQDTYPGKWGSLVPFGLRLIWAEITAHTGKIQESLDRLYYLLMIIQQILGNLDSGSAPDGSPMKLSVQSRQEGTSIWTSRRLRVQYAIANALCQIKDYDSGLKLYEEIVKAEEDVKRKKAVLTGVGRLMLQLGDVKGAREYFDKSEDCILKEEGSNIDQNKIHKLMNSAYLNIGKGQFQEACTAFREITTLDPSNPIAQNNIAVCLIYLGRLREALVVLEGLVCDKPQTSLQDGVVFNLATLYELESSKAIEKKKQVLKLVAANKGDGFNPQCLKML